MDQEGNGEQDGIKKTVLVELNRMDQDSALVEVNRMDQEVRVNMCAIPVRNVKKSEDNMTVSMGEQADKCALV